MRDVTKKCGNCNKAGHSIRTCPLMAVASKLRADAMAKAVREKRC